LTISFFDVYSDSVCNTIGIKELENGCERADFGIDD